MSPAPHPAYVTWEFSACAFDHRPVWADYLISRVKERDTFCDYHDGTNILVSTKSDQSYQVII